MTPKEPLLPLYEFVSAPEPISLLTGKVEVELTEESRLTGTADLIMQFIPRPRIFFQVNKEQETSSNFSIFFQDLHSAIFSFNGQIIEGFCTKFGPRVDTSSASFHLNWVAKKHPLLFGDKKSKTSTSAIFHLFNFPDFQNNYCTDDAPLGCNLLKLSSDEWRVTIQSLTDGSTTEACKRIKNEGGCFLTHMMGVERKGGEPFSGEQASEQRLILGNFLSFVKGKICFPEFGVGFDTNGKRTWETICSPAIDEPLYSWFNPFETHQAELLFPLFVKRWKQSEGWRQCLSSAISWYTQANTKGASPSFSAAIILAQAALEQLAYHYLVVEKRMISEKGFEKLWVSDQLRLLFTSLNIPIEITEITPSIHSANRSLNKNDKWIDNPHALTVIRNSLVHVKSKNEEAIEECHYDTWRLSLWYIELTILAICGYSGTYENRLKLEWTRDFELVPWSNQEHDND